jgi:osmotically-inducible protein OsmY
MNATTRAKAKTVSGAAKSGAAAIRQLVAGSASVADARRQANATANDARKQAYSTIREARKQAGRQLVRARIAAARARAGSRARAAGASKKAVGAAGAAGLAAGYFLDPDAGKRRRHVARDRALALIRRGTARAERETSYRGGQVEGKLEAATRGGDGKPAANDQALADRVKSEIFQPADAPKDSVNVNVERGIVYLRGEVEQRDQINELVKKAGAIDGVAGVESLLHTPSA